MAAARKKTQGGIPTGFRFVKKRYGIEEYVFTKNGLRVLFGFDKDAPVAGLMVTYLVGSRNEVAGTTGSTHILEHMMFKGSKKFQPKKGMSVIDLLGKKGAQVNATTFLDRTNYYEVLPKEHFAFALELEADRMRYALITQKGLDGELPAVKSEYAMYANEPTSHLDEKVWATAFQNHPYHHSTIGWFEDIEHATAEKLTAFYDTFYHPNNAVVTVLGGIEKREAFTLIKKYFGVHSRSPQPIPQVYAQEEEQTGKRVIEVSRRGAANVVSLSYKVPEALHTDTPALMVLSEILASQTTSRFESTLVKKALVSKAYVHYQPFRDPSIMSFVALPVASDGHEKVTEAMMQEFVRVQAGGVTQEEVARVSAQLQTDMALARDGYYAQLSVLNEALAVGDWSFYHDLAKQVTQVTPSMVQEVAQKYLTDCGLTVGYYRATK